MALKTKKPSRDAAMTMITRRRALQTGAAAAAVATLPGLAEAQGAPVVKLRVLVR